MKRTLAQIVAQRRARLEFWKRQPPSEWRRLFIASARSDIQVWRKLFASQ